LSYHSTSVTDCTTHLIALRYIIQTICLCVYVLTCRMMRRTWRVGTGSARTRENNIHNNIMRGGNSTWKVLILYIYIKHNAPTSLPSLKKQENTTTNSVNNTVDCAVYTCVHTRRLYYFVVNFFSPQSHFIIIIMKSICE